MDGVKKVSRGATANHASSMDHRRVQKSATLNRKFVKKPVAQPKIRAAAGAASRSLRLQQNQRQLIQKQNTVRLQPSQKFAQQQQLKQQGRQQITQQSQQRGQGQQQVAQQQMRATRRQIVGANQANQRVASVAKQAAQRIAQQQLAKQQDLPAQKHQTVEIARARMAARKKATQPEHLSAQELKERAIQQALRKVDKIDNDTSMMAQFKDAGSGKLHFWQKRGFAIAASMAVISLALLGYLVHLNLPDISVRVAAMQTGIEKMYPSYVPSNYRLDGLVKEDAGRVTMNFKNNDGRKFSLMEEKSSWDSAAVLANYVKKNWGNDYTIAKGQGLTIYVSGSSAAWVNGGVLYVISDDEGNLSAADLHDIAVSL